MAERPARRFAPVTENALAKLRMRWPWLVAAALLGAAAATALSTGPPTYETTAIMQITDGSQDSNRIKQVAQTVERTATSMNVVSKAAKKRGEDAADLAARTTAQWQTDTDVIYVSVRGLEAQEVVKDANALVASLGAFYDQQARVEIKELSAQGNELLSSGRLKDAAAEQARRAGVGAALATQQGAAAAGFTTVTLLDSASTAARTGVSRPVALALGAFVGLVLSAVAAMLLPFRRRRVRSAAEVSALLHGLRGVSAEKTGPAEIAGLFLESERSDLAVIATEGTAMASRAFAADVVALLKAHGKSASVLDTLRTPLGPPAMENAPARQTGATAKVAEPNLSNIRFLGQSGRSETRKKDAVTALVMVTDDRPEPLSLLAGQGDVLAVLMVRARRKSTEELRGLVAPLRYSDPTVVMLP